MEDNNTRHFCESYNLKSLIKVPACYKNSENPSCIDFILTSKYRNFQNSCVTETSLSHFHKMTVTALRTQFRKLKPMELFHRDYTKFSNETFINSFQIKLDTQSISPNDFWNGVLNFCKICTETLKKNAPRKRKTIRGNQSPFINKEISKAIMKKTESGTNFWNIKQMKVGKHLLSNVIIVILTDIMDISGKL